MSDHNEAMRLADELVAPIGTQTSYQTAHEAAALIRKQAERIAELEARVHTCGPTCSKAGCINRRITAERDTLRAEVERLRVDAERIDYLEYEANELRTRETAEDDYEWVVRSNHMDQPHERDVATGKTIRAAIDTARKATQ